MQRAQDLLTAYLRSLDEDTAGVDQAHLILSGAKVEVDVSDRATMFSTAGLGVYVDFLLEGLSIRARLGASDVFRAALVEACGNSVLLVVGDVDLARAEEVQAALRRGIERLRVGEGLEDRLERAPVP